MEDFEFYNSTRIVFGKESLNKLSDLIKTNGGHRVLLHYGGDSIKKTGVLDKVKECLNKAKISYVELGGAVPNPRLQLSLKGAALARSKHVDFVLAIGGGSVIDSAKCLACAVCCDDIWSYFMDGSKIITKALPVGVVLTIPAAGSESSNGAVITDEKTKLKRDACSEVMLPKFAIVNPEFTYTLPDNQISNGVADILAHMMERYFTSAENIDYTNQLLESAMKFVVENAQKIYKNKENYGLRANISLAAIYAHNGMFGVGRIGDWASHCIEHELSAINDISHGAGLAIIFPAWMKYLHSKKVGEKIFVRFAKYVFGVEDKVNADMIIDEGIKRLVSFYKSIKLPVSLKEVNITQKDFKKIANNAVLNRGTIGNLLKLTADDVYQILLLAK